LPKPGALRKLVDVTHNSVAKHALIIGDGMKDLWVHRKGAAPADKGVVPCPGSRGDFSWLLEPTGDGQHNGELSQVLRLFPSITLHIAAISLAHGAGRRHGRQALRKSGTMLSKSDLTKTGLGSEVVCTDTDLLLEERPEAYKDVGCVVDDMEDNGICRGVAILRPVVTYKIREEGRRK
jgi:release factor H-coupled RctB family protein